MLQDQDIFDFCLLGNFKIFDSSSNKVIFPSDAGLFIHFVSLKAPK